MLSESKNPQSFLDNSELVYTADEITAAIEQVAQQIVRDLAHSKPVVICVMTGGLYFLGRLLPQLGFPLELDYVHATRYQHNLTGDKLNWIKAPPDLTGRMVLVVDDILDEGVTLAAVKAQCLVAGAADVKTAVLVEKENGHLKTVKSDYCGLVVPNRFVFGCGMDIEGWWRNLPQIVALKEN